MSANYEQTDRNIDIFLRGFNDDGDCWEWEMSINQDGYGTFFDGTRNLLAHRFSFVYYNYELDDNLVIDHKCENRRCVNPKHLQQIDRILNTQYSPLTVSVVNRSKPFCVNGHVFPEKGKKGMTRVCEICKLNRAIEHKRRVKERDIIWDKSIKKYIENDKMI